MSSSTAAPMAGAAMPTAKQGVAAIAPNSETLHHLNSLVATTAALRRAGYVVEKLTNSELELKKRCLTCGVRIGKRTRRGDRQGRGQKSERPQLAEAGQQPRGEGSDSPASGNANPTPGNADEARPKVYLRCNYHPGQVVYKAWTCCGKYLTAGPCTAKEEHDVPEMTEHDRLAIERRWQFHSTSERTQPGHRVAVALDCEMGTAIDDDSELIRLTVVDYFTGEPLIDRLVYPDIKMKHFNTRWSGITRGDMERARRQGQCIFGRDGARRAIFDYVGPWTIVVGHGAQNDLSSLRWIHHRVVDSHMVEWERRKEAERKEEQEKSKNKEEDDKLEENGDKSKDGKPENGQPRGKHHPDGMSLKALTMKRLGRAIQVGKKGHDSLEDALAARDLIHAHILGLGGSEN